MEALWWMFCKIVEVFRFPLQNEGAFLCGNEAKVVRDRHFILSKVNHF